MAPQSDGLADDEEDFGFFFFPCAAMAATVPPTAATAATPMTIFAAVDRPESADGASDASPGAVGAVDGSDDASLEDDVGEGDWEPFDESSSGWGVAIAVWFAAHHTG